MTLALLTATLAGWLLGSFPVAYFVVRRTHGLDLRQEGSANLGANNAFRTTGSRRIGALVMGLDALKGLLAVAAGWAVDGAIGGAPWGMLGAGSSLWTGSAALLGAIAGHNYNLFLSLSSGRLAGGKGLATGAGGFLLLMPLLVLAWGLLFGVGVWAFHRRQGVRDAIPGNVLATALVPTVGWLLYGASGALIALGFAALVLPKHVRQWRELWAVPPLKVEGARNNETGR